MQKNDPMKERRDALDLAIQALDRYRVSLENFATSSRNAVQKIDELNRAIQILIAMKDKGPLL